MFKEADSICLNCMGFLNADGSCPRCGKNVQVNNPKTLLAAGTVVADRYLVGKVVGVAGDGALYLAFDLLSSIRVYLQEYCPDKLCVRTADQSLQPALHCEAQYKALLSDFIDLGKSLRRLDHVSSMVKILDIVSGFHTAYMVYEYVNGISYEQFLEQYKGPLDFETVLDLFLPLLYTIREANAQGIVHRGISPKTVLVNKNGELKLFRFSIPELRTITNEITAELFAGYAAPEQYTASGWQGTWTDVYGVSALLYRTLTGTAPEPAKGRISYDNISLDALLEKGVPQEAAEGIVKGLQLSPAQRLQNLEELIACLTASQQPKEEIRTLLFSTDRPQSASKPEKPAESQPPKKPFKRSLSGGLIWLITTTVTSIILAVCCLVAYNAVVKPVVQQSENSSALSSSGENASASSQVPDRLVPDFVGDLASDVMLNTDYAEMFEFVTVEVSNDTYPEGVICDQSPVAKTTVPQGSKIVLQVSTGPKPVEMPNLVGKTTQEAIDELESRSILYEIMYTYDYTYAPGYVLRTSVSAGDLVTPKTDKVFVFITTDQFEQADSNGSGSLQDDDWNWQQ